MQEIFECIAPAGTGTHRVILNDLTVVADVDSSDFTVYNSITTVGANYFTDGKYLSCYISELINTAGQKK